VSIAYFFKLIPLLTTLTAGNAAGRSGEVVGLELWRTALNALRQLNADNTPYIAILAAMVDFVPKVFHRQYEMKKTDTRHMRAVLDYVLFLQDPNNTVDAIQRRQCKAPYYRNDVIGALRDAIPGQIFMQSGIDWDKERLQDNDVGPVILAARSFILELTELKSGEGLTGTETFTGVTFVKKEASGSRHGSSLSSDDSTLANLPPNQETALETARTALDQPMSARSAGTTASEMLRSFQMPLPQMGSPSRRVLLPSREMRSHTRSLSSKRAASENRGQASKRTKVDGAIEEAVIPQERTGRGKQNRWQMTATPTLAHEMVKVRASIAGPVLEFQDVVQDLEEEIGELKTKLTARDLEIDDLRANVTKLAEIAAKQAQNPVEVACLKEALKASADKAARLENEIAVVRVLAKGNGVTEDQINAQLAKITGLGKAFERS
jgi:hypothetical protein